MAKRKLPPLSLPPFRPDSNTDPIEAAFKGEVRAAAQAKEGAARFTQTFEQFFRAISPSPNYAWGKHTYAIAAQLQEAVERKEAGLCTHVIINVPPRHGKSDQASRRFPVFCLCRHPDWEVMLATAAASLSETLARNARSCFETVGPQYGLRFRHDQNQVCDWGVEGHRGSMYSLGLGGGSAGHGADVLVIDDYYANREEAESEAVRKRVWDAFRSDLMTRLAPVHIVIVLATCWHPEDLTMSILEEMKNDPAYPRFERLVFPAQGPDGSYLFPERFPPAWYEAQKKVVGQYGWQSLYQCDPQPRIGRMLRSDLAQIVDEMPSLKWIRVWDLASTERERVKEDPDFTVGVKAGFDGDCLFIADLVRGQWSATERDARILRTAEKDGRDVAQHIEAVAGYKDTYNRIKSALYGRSLVRSFIPQGDKVAHASVLEPLFETGKVKLLRAPWNAAFLAECAAFPKGKHDDQVDPAAESARILIASRRRMAIS